MADATEWESDFQLPEREPDPQLLLPADLRSEWVVVPRAVKEWREPVLMWMLACVTGFLLLRELNGWLSHLFVFAFGCFYFWGFVKASMRTAGTLRGRVHPDPLSYRTPPRPSPPSRGWRRL